VNPVTYAAPAHAPTPAIITAARPPTLNARAGQADPGTDDRPFEDRVSWETFLERKQAEHPDRGAGPERTATRRISDLLPSTSVAKTWLSGTIASAPITPPPRPTMTARDRSVRMTRGRP
jgi:hypothetical protein